MLISSVGALRAHTTFVADTCLIPSAVTPNSDGKNDLFVIPCLDSIGSKDSELIIFNRWGDRVFYASPYSNDFDGTHKGKKLPDGTYLYSFKSTKNGAIYKGYLTLMR